MNNKNSNLCFFELLMTLLLDMFLCTVLQFEYRICVVCVGLTLIHFVLRGKNMDELEVAQAQNKALQEKLEEQKTKLEHMAIARVQGETERVLIQYYALDRGEIRRRRIRSLSDA